MSNEPVPLTGLDPTRAGSSLNADNEEQQHSKEMIDKSSSSSASLYQQSTALDPSHQTQQQQQTGRPTSSLAQHLQHPQQQQSPQQPQQYAQQNPNQRWPENAPGSSQIAGLPPSGMMLASPHYPYQQQPQPVPQQYAISHPQQQQQHLAVPGQPPYPGGAYPGFLPPQQHSPSAGGGGTQRTYGPSTGAAGPPPQPQMLHPAIIYAPPLHGYPPPYMAQQYWASNAAAARSGGFPNGPPAVVIGQHPGIMGPPLQPPTATHCQQQSQPALVAQHDAPSTSRQTPNHLQVAPSPTAGGATNDEASIEESAGGLRPKSNQSQIHPSLQQQNPPTQQMAHMRYTSGMMSMPQMMPPGVAAVHQQQQFQPQLMGHPSMNGPPQMQMQHHMGPPPSQMHPQTMVQTFQGHPHQGMYFQPTFPSQHPAAAAAMAAAHHSQQQQQPQPQQPQVVNNSILPGLKPAQREAVEKLITQLANPKQQQLTPELLYERRLFYERLVMLNEQQGEILTAPPQVSKTTVDLHSLYFAVRKKGGFKKTIQDKIWKNLCTDANVLMQQSSAAGFQLRKHYQKFLLKLECMETGQNEKELVEFAEKQKKKKKEKDPIAEPPTPSSSSSTANKDEQQQINRTSNEMGQPAQGTAINGPIAQQQQAGSVRVNTPNGASAAGSTLQLPYSTPVPSSSAGQVPGSAEYPQSNTAGYALPPPGTFTPQQYPPPTPQWYQQQQMLHRPQQMRPPPSQQQLTEDEQQQQLNNQRLASTSSRLSATSTPAGGEQQKPPSRASSVAVSGAIGDKLESSDEQQLRDYGQQTQQQLQHQRKTQTPSSAFSANAPTPPLTISTHSATNPNSQLSSGAASTIQSPHHQQQQLPPSGYYHHPSGAYVRYPLPPGIPTAGGEPSQFYGQGPPGAVYTQQQQSQMWTYAVHPTSAAVRYQLPPATVTAIASTGRYQPAAYTSQAQSTTGPVASNTTFITGAQNIPPSTSSQSQSTASQQPTHNSSGKTKQHQHATTTASKNSGNNNNATGVQAVAGMVPPAAVVPTVLPALPPYVSVPQYPAWFGAITACTHPSPFTADSLEAQTIAQIQQLQQQQVQQQRYRRPKVYARDLHAATPERILMALRSGLHVETCWALNALNIQLNDDTNMNAAPSLAQIPELLNLLVDHFTAALSLLYARHLEANYPMDWSSHALHTIKTSKNNTINKNNHNSDINAKTKCIDGMNIISTKLMDNICNNNNSKNDIQQMVCPPPQQQNTNGNNAQNSTANFTMISRLGRVVKLDTNVKIPSILAKQFNLQEKQWLCSKQNDYEDTNDNKLDGKDENDENNTVPEETLFLPEFVQRLRNSILVHIRAKHALKKLVPFKQHDIEEEVSNGKECCHWWYDNDNEEVDDAETDDGNQHSEEEGHVEKNSNSLFYRKPHPWEHWDQFSVHECALISRQNVLQHKHADELICQLVDRCLTLSNILRGYSFLPGQERTLAQHTRLLRLLPALLMLMVDAQSQRKCANSKIKHGCCQFNLAQTNPPDSTKTVETTTHDTEQQHEEEQKIALLINKKNINVPAEKDTYQQWFMEIANQLRDDAFTILAHISPHLDLFDADSVISWPIFDSLLHWSVCTELTARDPLPPFGAISPRHYALEILCKMSVLERNVDLLVATGPWPRQEAFVRLLCTLICDEMPPVREFAIVILYAMCAACEPACYIAAVETRLLEHLVQFLEAADANMTQIAQQQGIHTLRENPEIIGTSVGMLRRAAHIMVQLAKNERCRQQFYGFQHRLLQFTVSHFMDSRVAAMVADILFEIQRSAGDNNHNKHPQFPSSSSASNKLKVAKEGGNDDTDEQQERKQSVASSSVSSAGIGTTTLTTIATVENNHHWPSMDEPLSEQQHFNTNNSNAAVIKHHFSGEIAPIDDAAVDHTEQLVFNGGDCIPNDNGILLISDNDSGTGIYCGDMNNQHIVTIYNNNDCCDGLRCSSALSTASSLPLDNNNSTRNGNLAIKVIKKRQKSGDGNKTPNRKRPRSGKCKTAEEQQQLLIVEKNIYAEKEEKHKDYLTCNGGDNHAPDEIKNNINFCDGLSPPEKRTKKNDDADNDDPDAGTNNVHTPTLTTTPTAPILSENVRERMRNNILGKTVVTNGNNNTNTENNMRKKNGWIVDSSLALSVQPLQTT